MRGDAAAGEVRGRPPSPARWRGPCRRRRARRPPLRLTPQAARLLDRVRSLEADLAAERATRMELQELLTKAEAAADAERRARGAADDAASAGAPPPSRLAPPPADAEAAARQIAALKAARERLIAAVEASSAEAERAERDARALGAALLDAGADADAWERAAQEAVARADALADLLAEGAAWPRAGGGEPTTVETLTSALATERAARARAEVHVAALCVELGRARRGAARVAAAAPAALAAVEARLAAVAAPR